MAESQVRAPPSWKHRPEGGTRGSLALIVGIARHGGRGLARLCLYPITLYFYLRRTGEQLHQEDRIQELRRDQRAQQQHRQQDKLDAPGLRMNRDRLGRDGIGLAGHVRPPFRKGPRAAGSARSP